MNGFEGLVVVGVAPLATALADGAVEPQTGLAHPEGVDGVVGAESLPGSELEQTGEDEEWLVAELWRQTA